MKKFFKRVVASTLVASLFSFPVIATNGATSIDKINSLTNLLSGNIADNKGNNIVRLDFSKAIEIRKNIENSLNEENIKSNASDASKLNKENKTEIKKMNEVKQQPVESSDKKEEKKVEDSTEAVANEDKSVEKVTEKVVEKEPTTETSSERVSTTSSSNNSTFGLSQDEYKLFVAIVDVEASGDSYQEKLGVANVILNRIKYGWGSSIKEIVYQKGQFPPAHNGVLADRLVKGPWSEDSEKAVREALSGNNNIETAQSFNMYYGQTAPGKTLIMGNTFFYNYK